MRPTSLRRGTKPRFERHRRGKIAGDGRQHVARLRVERTTHRLRQDATGVVLSPAASSRMVCGESLPRNMVTRPIRPWEAAAAVLVATGAKRIGVGRDRRPGRLAGLGAANHDVFLPLRRLNVPRGQLAVLDGSAEHRALRSRCSWKSASQSAGQAGNRWILSPASCTSIRCKATEPAPK